MIERAKLTVGKLSAALIWIRPRWRAANAPMVALGGHLCLTPHAVGVGRPNHSNRVSVTTHA